MKIAAITDDSKTISQHFGRAAYYLVVTVEDSQIVERELREKLGHAQFANQTHEHKPGQHHGHGSHEAGQPHGYGRQAHDRHNRMAATISDCQALLCRGMGMGAYESMKSLGIQPVVTDIASIEDAVTAYLKGELVDRTDLLH